MCLCRFAGGFLICSVAEDWPHCGKWSICLAPSSSQVSLVYLHTLCTVEHQTYQSPSTWQRWHQAVYIVSGFRLISVETPGGRDFIPISQIRNVAFKVMGIEQMLCFPGFLDVNVSCGLCPHASLLWSQESVALRNKEKQTGKGPHHYLGPPTTTFHTSQEAAGFWDVYP